MRAVCPRNGRNISVFPPFRNRGGIQSYALSNRPVAVERAVLDDALAACPLAWSGCTYLLVPIVRREVDCKRAASLAAILMQEFQNLVQ